MMGFLIGVIVWLALVALGMGSFIPAFLDIPSAVIAFVPVIVIATVATSLSTFAQSMKFVFGKAVPSSESEMKRSAMFYSTLGNCGVLSGIIGTIIGAVILLQNLDDPKKIGPAVAISLLTVFYGVMFKFFAYAAEQRVRFKYLG